MNPICAPSAPVDLDGFKALVESCVSASLGRSDWQGDLALGSLIALPALIILLILLVASKARQVHDE